MAKVSVSDIRRKIRQSLLDEARSQYLASPSGGDKDPTRRSRGGDISESADAAMVRLRQQLRMAEVGDTFYITFILSNMKVVGGARAKSKDPTGRPVLEYTSDLYDLYKDMALGENNFFDAEQIRGSKSMAERQKKELQSDISSTIVAGQNMVTKGLQAIGGVQAARIGDLQSDIAEIRAGQMTPAQALSLLFGAQRTQSSGTAQTTIENTPTSIVLRSKPIFMPPGNIGQYARVLTDADAEPGAKKRAVDAIRSAVYGRSRSVRLTDANVMQERQLINGALIACVGSVLYNAGRPENGGIKIAGTGSPYTETHEKTGTLIQRVARMDPKRVTDLFTGEVESEEGAGRGVSEDARQMAAQLLIGSCATDCNFPEAQADINLDPGESLAMMEEAGVPSSILMHRVELLLSAIEEIYREGRVVTTRAKLLLAGTSPEGRSSGAPGAAIAWANHFDPQAAISLAMATNSRSPVPAAAAHETGPRIDSHYDARISTLTRALRSVPQGASSEDQARTMKAALPDATEAEISGVIKHEAAVSRLRTTQRDELFKRRGLEGYGVKRALSGRTQGPRNVMEQVRSIRASQGGEEAIYKYLLEPLQYGVTMRCTGKSLVPQFSVKALTAAEQGDPAETLVEMPVFDVKAEEPRQSAINRIQDPEVVQRLRMSANAFGQQSKGVSYQSVVETGVAPDEGGGTRYVQRGSGGPRPDISCTMVSLPPFVEALSGEKSYSQEVAEAVDSGTVILDGTLTVPYIEKVPASYKQVGPDFIDTMERTLDGRLRPRNVTLQLMSAVKTRGSSRGDLRVVPSAGLGRGFGPGGINEEVVAKFDVAGGRTILDPLSASPFREDVKDALEDMRLRVHSMPLFDQISVHQAMLDYQRILNSSHSKSDEEFESLVNAKAAAHGLSTIRDELERISAGRINVPELTNLQQQDFSARIRRLASALNNASRSGAGEDAERAAMAAATALKIIGALDLQNSEGTSPGILRASPVVIAALHTSASPDAGDVSPATSEADLRSRNPQKGTTMPLHGVLDAASRAAGEALLEFRDLKIDQLIRVAQRGTARFTEEIQSHGIEETSAGTDLMESFKATHLEFTELHDAMPDHKEMVDVAKEIVDAYKEILSKIDRSGGVGVAGVASTAATNEDFYPLTTATSAGLQSKKDMIEQCVNAHIARTQVQGAGFVKGSSGTKRVAEIAAEYYDLLVRVRDEFIEQYDIEQMVQDVNDVLVSTLGLQTSIEDVIEDARGKIALAQRHGERLQEIERDSKAAGSQLRELDELFSSIAVEIRSVTDRAASAPVSRGITCARLLSGAGDTSSSLMVFASEAYLSYTKLQGIATDRLIPLVYPTMMKSMSQAATRVRVPRDPMALIKARETAERVTEDEPSDVAVVTPEVRDALSIDPVQARVIKAFIEGETVGGTRVVDFAALSTDPYAAAKRIITNILRSATRGSPEFVFAARLRTAMYPLTSQSGISGALKMPDDPVARGTLDQMIGLRPSLRMMAREIKAAYDSIRTLLEMAIKQGDLEANRSGQLAIIACGAYLNLRPEADAFARTGGRRTTPEGEVEVGRVRPATPAAVKIRRPFASTGAFSRAAMGSVPSPTEVPTAYQGTRPTETEYGEQVADVSARAQKLSEILGNRDSVAAGLDRLTLEELTLKAVEGDGADMETLRSLLPLAANDFVRLSRRLAERLRGRGATDDERRVAAEAAEAKARADLPGMVAANLPKRISALQAAVLAAFRAGGAPPAASPAAAPAPAPVGPERAPPVESAGLTGEGRALLNRSSSVIDEAGKNEEFAATAVKELTRVIRESGGEITDAEVEEMVSARGSKGAVEELFQRLAGLAPKTV